VPVSSGLRCHERGRLVGTNFGQRHHPGWTANLVAHADASIEVGPERLPVTGELANRAMWERLWPRFVAVYRGYADYLTRCAPRRPRMFRLRPHPAELSNRQ
jgi:deazaflavin-dependent oxidoreductase (nitroreductase family)